MDKSQDDVFRERLGMSRASKKRSPRERAARALCVLAGNPENIPFDGKPIWMSFLPDADAALKAALTPEEWERIEAEGP